MIGGIGIGVETKKLIIQLQINSGLLTSTDKVQDVSTNLSNNGIFSFSRSRISAPAPGLDRFKILAAS